MPPQDKQAAPKYSPDEVTAVLASPEFRSAPPETQRALREALGIPLGEGTPVRPAPPKPPVSAMDWLLGTLGPKKSEFEGQGAIASLNRWATGLSQKMRMEDLRRASQGKRVQPLSPLGAPEPRALGEFGLDIFGSTARQLGGAATPKGAALTAASAYPPARPFVGLYGVATGAKDLLRPRDPEAESVPDYLERILSAGAVVSGSAALAGRFRTPAQELSRRVSRASYASGSEPGVPNAYRLALPDIVETIKTFGMKIRTVADIAKAVEATNQRFNTQMALAEQPFAGDKIIPQKAIDALRAAADDMAPSQHAEAAELRDEATRLASKPMTLRDLGREVRHQNALYGTHAGKTSLELSTAKTRASVAINDLLRKNLRDTYVDYLESKYPGSQLGDMRLRQEQVLKLREQLGTYNPKTKAFEKGYVEKLKSLQARHEGGPGDQVAGGVATQHGVRGYLRLPKSMRRGPETHADVAAKKAFREEILGSKLPRRALPKLKAAPEAPPTGLPKMKAPVPTKPPDPAEMEMHIRVNTLPEARRVLREAEASGNQGAIDRAREELKFHEGRLSLARQAAAAKKHPDWAARVQSKMEASESKATEAATEPKSPAGPLAKKAIPGKFTAEQTKQWTAELERHRNAVEFHKGNKSGEELSKALKGEGMQHSANKRQISGQLTAKEASNKAKYEESFHRGKRVSVHGREGEVVGMSFGKVRVKLTSGNIVTVAQDQVESLK